MDEWNQEEPGELQVMGLIARGKLPRETIPRARRSAVMREINGLRRVRGGGRPRTVGHAPGPRGGCRCADCRAQGKAGRGPKRIMGFEVAGEVEWE